MEDLRRAARRLEDVLEDLRHRTIPAAPAERKSGSFSAMKGLLTLPVEGKIIGRFGVYKTPRLHMKARRNGVEIEAEEGAPVKAVFQGRVVYSDWFRGYGNLIIIDHGEGFYTVYAHALERFKENEERVEAGEVIATVGESGLNGKALLYFEIRRHEKPVDPLSWLRKE
jgi:septal ring factor EnvC (AmiA/AmiB activator)